MDLAMLGGLLTGLFLSCALYLFAVIDELSFAAIRTSRLAQVCAAYCAAFITLVIVLTIL